MSVEEVAPEEVERSWQREIERRAAAYEAGKVETIPAAEVFREASRLLAEARKELLEAVRVL